MSDPEMQALCQDYKSQTITTKTTTTTTKNGHVLLRSSNGNIGYLNGGPSMNYYGSSGGGSVTRWWFNFLKSINVKRCVAFLVIITVITILYYTHYVVSAPFVR